MVAWAPVLYSFNQGWDTSGTDMPGIRVLRGGCSRISVQLLILAANLAENPTTLSAGLLPGTFRITSLAETRGGVSVLIPTFTKTRTLMLYR